jgi:hypothetical protein
MSQIVSKMITYRIGVIVTVTLVDTQLSIDRLNLNLSSVQWKELAAAALVA